MIVDILQSAFNVSTVDINRAKNYQSKYGGRIERILLNMGSISEESLPELYSRTFNLSLYSKPLDDEQLAHHLLNSIVNVQALISAEAYPYALDENQLFVACKDPLSLELNQWIASTSYDVQLSVLSSELEQYFSHLYKVNVDTANQDVSDDFSDDEKLKELASEAPTVNLLNSLLTKALRQGASDMHLEPYQNKYRIRVRVDGVLHELDTLSSKMQLPIVTRLKILSGMDIAEKRRPQDGKIELKIANQEIDIRVSALPLNDGESMVLRFLKKESVKYDMSVLGLSPDIKLLIQKDIKTTAGVILLTGPTGSGKTTTLYTFLNELNNNDVKIITLEDPVEYQLEGINQVQVNSEIGFDFASGLRSIVRQDPDIIMLGEIRDKETAQIALQSALTGHLVFSTVHTNDAASAYTRLLDLGVDEFLLNAALVSIVAQRLARKICKHCKQPVSDSDAFIKEHQLVELAKQFNINDISLSHGKGCEQCGHTGYKGRIALVEYLACDDQIKTMKKNGDFLQKAKQYNKQLNRRTLVEDGLLKAIQGITTIEEVFRVAG